MRIDTLHNLFTLDWDDITRDELRRRLAYMEANLKTLRRYTVLLSPNSGYHIRVECSGLVHVANMRRLFKDDGRRLINDILNRPDNVHDILWTRKTSRGLVFESKKLYTKVFYTIHGEEDYGRIGDSHYYDYNGRPVLNRPIS